MKKINALWLIIMAIVLVIVLSVLLVLSKQGKIKLPNIDSVIYASMNQYIDNTPIGEVTITDKITIQEILNALSGASKRWGINGMSVNDYPVSDNYLIIRLYLENEMRTLCLFSDGADYIEEPYIGIYRAKGKFDYIHTVYSDYINGNVAIEWLIPSEALYRQYTLENPTERQKLERMMYVNLYIDGSAALSQPFISSNLLPQCRYSFVDDELIIYANENDYGIENGSIVAIFAVVDDNTIIFQSSTVELFADSGARYVCTPVLIIPATNYEAQKWVDYYLDDEMPWTSTFDLMLDEFPGIIFNWTSEKVTATNGNGVKDLFWGMPVWNVFLADLNGDGLPEFCATVSMGSGVVDTRIVIYDYANDLLYDLSDRMYYDYSLSLENRQLVVTQSNYLTYPGSGQRIATGSIAIINGELVTFGIDRTLPIQEAMSQYNSSLEMAVSQAIISKNTYAHLEGAYRTEAHTTLHTDENDKDVTVYAMVYSAAFSFSDNKLRLSGGSHMPIATTFEKDNSGAYTLVEYWTPQDGSLYLSSIQAKFPRSIWDKIDTQLYIADHSLTALRNAQNYYDVTDYIAPEIIILKPLEMEKGSKPNWEDYFKIVDDIDGQIDLSEAYIWDVMIEFDKPGKYPLQIIVQDNAGNENRSLDNVVTIK